MTKIKYEKEVVPYVANLDDLRTKMLNETDFSVPFECFMDRVIDDQAFKSICKKIKRPILQNALERIAQKAVENCVISKMLFFKPPSYPFVHGIFSINLLIAAAFFYFEDVNTGLLCISFPDDNVIYSRFADHTEAEVKTLQSGIN